jgi:uncharacterized membrane protein
MISSFLASLAHWWATRPTHTRVILAIATTMFLVELAFRYFAPGSKAYTYWTRFFQALGKFWTAVILAFVYFLSVALVGIGLKLLRKDPLDRTLAPEPSFWRTHEPNPLGPSAAARHQF